MTRCYCGFEDEDDSHFTWNRVDPKDFGTDLMLLCWDCTDNLHKAFIEEANAKEEYDCS